MDFLEKRKLNRFHKFQFPMGERPVIDIPAVVGKFACPSFGTMISSIVIKTTKCFIVFDYDKLFTIIKLDSEFKFVVFHVAITLVADLNAVKGLFIMFPIHCIKECFPFSEDAILFHEHCIQYSLFESI